MKIALIALSLVICISFADDPTDILVHYENSVGYGENVINAINNLWPTVTIHAYCGDTWTSFNDALDTGTYDLIILENWYYNTDDCNWEKLCDLYNSSDVRIFLSDWKLSLGTTGVQTLMNYMGVSGATSNGDVKTHYAWEVTHPICDGITDWSQENPGLGILSNNLTVSDAIPVTGWVSSPQSGQAGICVANDGSSIVSGYTPAYSVDGLAIWENILDFMWDPTTLESTTWGDIKANF